MEGFSDSGGVVQGHAGGANAGQDQADRPGDRNQRVGQRHLRVIGPGGAVQHQPGLGTVT